MQNQFLLIESKVLPEVFIKVLNAKQLLSSGKAKNVSEATKQVQLSRSAFYKYKDSIFTADAISDIFTIVVVLIDEKGALQTLLAVLSHEGANVVTINQSQPSNGTAAVSVTMQTSEMSLSIDELITKLKQQQTVVDVKRSS